MPHGIMKLENSDLKYQLIVTWWCHMATWNLKTVTENINSLLPGDATWHHETWKQWLKISTHCYLVMSHGIMKLENSDRKYQLLVTRWCHMASWNLKTVTENINSLLPGDATWHHETWKQWQKISTPCYLVMPHGIMKLENSDRKYQLLVTRWCHMASWNLKTVTENINSLLPGDATWHHETWKQWQKISTPCYPVMPHGFMKLENSDIKYQLIVTWWCHMASWNLTNIIMAPSHCLN